jgi:hypothetical protein
VQELLPQQQQQQKQQQEEGVDSIHAWHFSTVSAASRLLWVFGNVGRHPGPQLLGAALSRVVAAATEAADAGLPLPLREITTALYAVTVLQELQHPGAVALAQLLQQAAADGELMSHPQFLQNSEHLAGCLLAAQDAAQAGVGAPPPAPIASFHDADQASAAAADAAAAMDGRSQGANSTTQSAPSSSAAAAAAAAARGSPWLALPVDVQQRLQEAWRRKVLRKAGKKQGMGEHMQLLLSLRQLGLRGKAKALTDDGVVCIDVAVATVNGECVGVGVQYCTSTVMCTGCRLGADWAGSTSVKVNKSNLHSVHDGAGSVYPTDCQQLATMGCWRAGVAGQLLSQAWTRPVATSRRPEAQFHTTTSGEHAAFSVANPQACLV